MFQILINEQDKLLWDCSILYMTKLTTRVDFGQAF